MTVSRALKLAAFVAFLAALCVAEAWLKIGTWQEWTSGGLALAVASDLV